MFTPGFARMHIASYIVGHYLQESNLFIGHFDKVFECS